LIVERMMEMILGYDRNDWERFSIKNPIQVKIGKNISSILIAGKSGSGKSLSVRWYIWQLLRERESLVYISDYKSAREHEAYEDSSSYASSEKAFDMINDFYQFFTEVRNKNSDCDNRTYL